MRSRSTTTLPERVRLFASQRQMTLPVHIELVLKAIDNITQQIRELDRAVKTIARSSAICQYLMSTPGVGPITAVTFLATIDDPSRFERAHHVASYLGLTPGENSSSERQQRTSITKAGSSSMRRTLIQAAWIAFRRRPNDPMVQWAQRVANRRGKNIAVVALARKMSGVMYALWRDNAHYNPTRSAAAPA